MQYRTFFKFVVFLLSIFLGDTNLQAKDLLDQLPEALEGVKEGQILFLDSDRPRTLFSNPGYNYQTCKDKLCEKVGWPDRSTELVYTGKNKTLPVADVTTQEIENVNFVEVEFKNSSGDKVKGWMVSSPLKQKKYNPIYSKLEKPIKESKSDKNCKRKTDFAETIGEIKNHTEINYIKNLDEAILSLKPIVGRCPLDPPNKLDKWNSGLVYDQAVLPSLKKQAVPNIIKENGQKMSREDLIAIDALARSIYAEMARCFDDGLQYPLAVARVIVNRADYVRDARDNDQAFLASNFVKDESAKEKNEIAQVATQSVQFSCWNQKIDGKPNVSGLTHSLCPPVDKDAVFWTGGKPSEAELDIWEDTLKIATEAVLYPNSFKNERTKGLENRYFYTSGSASISGMKYVKNVELEERVLAKKACVKIYDGKPTAIRELASENEIKKPSVLQRVFKSLKK